jgi:hypothetical protein
VIVDTGRCHLPGGELVGSIGQGLKGRTVEALKEAAAASRELREGAIVEPLEPLGNGLVGLGHGEERQIPDACQNPALCHQDTDLDFRLIPGLPRASRDDGQP